MQSSPQKVFNSKRFISVCLSLLKHTSEVIRDVHATGDLGKVMKGPGDPVTEADLKAQYVIETGLRKYWPGIRIIGEESAKSLLPVLFELGDKDGEGFGLSELDQYDQDVDLADIVVYIDPLDGTRNFTEGRLNEVTTLIGVSYKRAPYIGLIGQVWDKQANQAGYYFNPSVYLGMVGIPAVYHVKNNMQDAVSLIKAYSKFKPHDPSQPWRINISSRSYIKSLEDMLSLFEPSCQKSVLPGMGIRFVGVIRGETDGFVSNTASSARWDSLAGTVLVHALGGKVTGVCGTNYLYDGNPANIVNDDGMFPLNDSDYHSKMLIKFLEYYKSRS